MTITHTQDCEDLSLGRAIRLGYTLERSLPEVVESYRVFTGDRCDCGKLALGRVSEELRRVRKAERYYGLTTSERTERIAALVAERDALRLELQQTGPGV